MYKAKYSVRRLKDGNYSVTGRVKLACGYKLDETFRARTEELARRSVDRFLELRVQGHIKDCKKSH